MNRFIRILKRIARRFYDRNESFNKTLRKQGAKIGNNVQIVDRKKFLYEPWYCDLIELGNEVVISAGVRFVNHDSSYANVAGSLPIKYGMIKIGSKSYIGVNSVILPGIEIGENCLIGAGSIVNRNIPSNTIAAGNPIRIIGSIENGIIKYKQRINEKNNLVDYIDLGGSYSQMFLKHGTATTDYILKSYKDFYSKKNKV